MSPTAVILPPRDLRIGRAELGFKACPFSTPIRRRSARPFLIAFHSFHGSHKLPIPPAAHTTQECAGVKGPAASYVLHTVLLSLEGIWRCHYPPRPLGDSRPWTVVPDCFFPLSGRLRLYGSHPIDSLTEVDRAASCNYRSYGLESGMLCESFVSVL